MNNWFNDDTEIEVSLIQGFRLQLTIDMQAKQIPHHRYNPFIARCLKEDCEYTLSIHDFQMSEVVLPALVRSNYRRQNNYLGPMNNTGVWVFGNASSTNKAPSSNKPNRYSESYLDLRDYYRHEQLLRDEKLIREELYRALNYYKSIQDVDNAAIIASKLVTKDFTVDDLLAKQLQKTKDDLRKHITQYPVGIGARRQYLQLYRLLHNY